MKLRAVIFDYGNVICRPPTPRQLSEAAELCGFTVEDFIQAFWRKRREYDRGSDARAYWQDIAQSSGRVFDDALIDEMMRREVDFWGRFDDRVLNWARDLRAAGLRTGILSNLPRTLGERLRSEVGFLDHFDQVTFSYELGVIKPEAPIYLHALEGLGVAPAEALFLDDRPENVEGARAVGICAEVFNSWEEFLARDCLRLGLPRPEKRDGD
ncbi:MAG: HAD family phosphatase [Acidobacteriota bacterium]|nr:HAD family phosphatase [Acidobacteriota bacterium]MDP9148245.1 HAD family phosphatase [Acidobacteriota bacterium]